MRKRKIAGGTIRIRRIAVSTATSGEIAGTLGSAARNEAEMARLSKRTVTDDALCYPSPEHLVEYLRRAVGVLVELVRADEEFRHAGARRDHGGQDVVGGNVRAHREVIRRGQYLLPFLGQDEFRQQQRRMRIARPFRDDHGPRR